MSAVRTEVSKYELLSLGGISSIHYCDLQLEASMCHLRGVLYMRLNRVERAKKCFLEALALDVKCFESFNTLIQCQMLTVEEGERFFLKKSMPISQN